MGEGFGRGRGTLLKDIIDMKRVFSARVEFDDVTNKVTLNAICLLCGIHLETKFYNLQFFLPKR